VKRLLLVTLLAGCFPPGPPATDDGGTSGFGTPTVLLTIGGVRLGPGVPDSSAGVTLIDEVNPITGRTTRSQITISATSAAAMGGCQLYAERFGDGILGFFATNYLIETPTTAMTRDGTASPGAGELVTAGANVFRCNGSDCNGAVLSIGRISTTHVEGYLSGTFVADSGAGATSVVCSFYLPRR